MKAVSDDFITFAFILFPELVNKTLVILIIGIIRGVIDFHRAMRVDIGRVMTHKFGIYSKSILSWTLVLGSVIAANDSALLLSLVQSFRSFISDLF